MASEKQIAANRANAQKSTGPKTAAGRSKAGRNAFRHGLSLPVEIDGDVSAKIEALVEALVSNNLDTDRQLAIAEIAQAHQELLQIRKVRTQMLAGTKLEERPKGPAAVGGAGPLRTLCPHQAAAGGAQNLDTCSRRLFCWNEANGVTGLQPANLSYIAGPSYRTRGYISRCAVPLPGAKPRLFAG
jgi:hypothetical protein